MQNSFEPSHQQASLPNIRDLTTTRRVAPCYATMMWIIYGNVYTNAIMQRKTTLTTYFKETLLQKIKLPLANLFIK